MANQGHLERSLREIFQHETFITNATKQAPIQDKITGFHLELDIYFPKLQLAFEFQDVHHFNSAWYYHNSLESVQYRDQLKVDLANAIGVTLLQIPCWWDQSNECLVGLISFRRPDLLYHSHLPIPMNPPFAYFSGGGIYGVGELMLASFLHPIVSLENIVSAFTPWWMGEKYDGIRFCWNTFAVHSRSGTELPLPHCVVTSLRRDIFLDGELWFGRSTFLESQQLVHSTETICWKTLRMIAFDVPYLEYQSQTFESRYTTLLDSVHVDHPFAQVAPRLLCTSPHLVTHITHSLIQHSAEGVVLRKCGSMYVGGRSENLLKFKKYREDSEALVVQVTHAHVVLRLPNEITIKASLPTEETRFKLGRGDIVTFSFTKCSQWGVPLDAAICRIRRDLSWHDVITRFMRDEVKSTRYDLERVFSKKRIEMEKVAKKHNKDPLVPDTWYSLFQELQNRFPQGTLINTLMRLFPDIGLEKSKFPSSTKQIVDWRASKDRRKFLCNVAKQNDFDPLVTKNWYSFTYNNVKGMSSLLKYYRGNIAKALVHLFPEIGINPAQFPVPHNHWNSVQNRKELFLQFAKENGFNPHSAEKWYSVPATSMHKFKGMRAALEHYKDVTDALMQLFPNIGLQREKFKSDFPRNHWKDPENRRELFAKFAQEKGFDPLVPDFWYSVSTYSLNDVQGSKSILKYHNGSVASALLEAFPDIGLEKHKFMHEDHLPRDYWKDNENQKLPFLHFANKNGFDPLIASNWHSIPIHHILQEKGIGSVLVHYNNSVPKALANVFKSNTTLASHS